MNMFGELWISFQSIVRPTENVLIRASFPKHINLYGPFHYQYSQNYYGHVQGVLKSINIFVSQFFIV